MIYPEFAKQFAREWVEAWNDHDLDRVLAHYAEDFEMSWPFIRQIAGEASGRLKGKPAVRAYWEKALGLMPELRFELLAVLVGVDSVVPHYRGVRLSAEVFHFGPEGTVVRALAHYA